MKKRKWLSILLMLGAWISLSMPIFAAEEQQPDEIAINETNFPDKVFRDYLIQSFDEDKNGMFSTEEINNITKIDFGWGDVLVSDLTGIQYLKNLKSINCASSLKGIKTLDFSENVSLQILDCSYNTELDSVNVSTCTELEEIQCFESGVNVLDVSNNTKLVRLDCNNTPVRSLDVTKCPELFALNCENTSVSNLDLSKNPKLYEVYITGNKGFTKLDISKNSELVHLRIGGTSLTQIDTSHNPKLAALYMENTDIKFIDISKNPDMFEIFCYDSKLEALDTSKLKNLRTLECYNTPIKKIDVSQSKELVGLQIQNTQISELDVRNNVSLIRLEVQNTALKELNISNCKKLEYLNITNTSISNFKEFDATVFKNMDELYCANAGIEKLTVGSLALSALSCEENAIPGLDLSRLGEGKEDYWGPYLGMTVSPQKRSVSCVFDKSNGNQILNLKNLVPDIKKVSVTEGEGYSYDSKAGVITITGKEDTTVSYTYDHGNSDLDSPISVTLKIHYHSDIGSSDVSKASFGKDGKSAGKYCKKCNEIITKEGVIPKVTAELSDNFHVYNKRRKTPAVIVKSGSKTLKNNVDYTVNYIGGFKNPGQYKVKVILKGAEYEGNTVFNYQVLPKNTKISKIKKGKKMLTVTWKKQKAQTDGYEVQYSLKRSFNSGVKSKLIKKNKSVSVKLKKLKAKKTYYVRIRTYKTVKVNNKYKKIYSKWSAVKKGKTK